jgi:FG-GAP repeat protein
MTTRSNSSLMFRVSRIAGLVIFASALQAPLHAASPPGMPPEATPFQTLEPEVSEYHLPNGDFQSTLLGATIASHGRTALIQEKGYANGASTGRVAVFTRGSDGMWVRNGSIDPPIDAVKGFGSVLAVFENVALISSDNGLFVFHREKGEWTFVQRLRLKTGWRFTSAALDDRFAFLATELSGQGVVYAYRIRPSGRLSDLHALNSGVDFDSFAEHLALSGDHLVVSATGDDDGRGAAYVFEHRGGERWVRRQKLVAIDGVSGDSFGSDVATAGNWIAVGAENALAGEPDGSCPGGSKGVLYVFHRSGRTWGPQQVLKRDDVRGDSSTCVSGLGQEIDMSRKWIVATTVLPGGGAFDVFTPVIFKRDAGHYTAIASAQSHRTATLDMSGRTLFEGTPADEGCAAVFCPGQATVYHLDDLAQ